MQCQDGLRDLELNELRFLLAQRCTIEDLKVLWFDLFQRRMDDEVSIHSTALSSVEIVDRSRREDLLADLIDKICRNHPRFNVKKA
jgi:hypothetical protein